MRRVDRLEIIALVVAYVACIVVVGIALRETLPALDSHPIVAEVVLCAVIIAACLGGFIAFAIGSDRVGFLVRGYRVTFRDKHPCYEERHPRTERHCLPFDRFPLTAGYRPRSVVRLSPATTWDVDVPPGARGRRDEIADRIARDLRSYAGWPAAVMPDTSSIDASDHVAVTRTLMVKIVEDCPE